MKFLCPVLVFVAVLTGCADVDPAAANHERNRQMTGLSLHDCLLSHLATPAAPVAPRCLA